MQITLLSTQKNSFKPFTKADAFKCFCRRQLLKTFWQKENLFIMRFNFSFSINVKRQSVFEPQLSHSFLVMVEKSHLCFTNGLNSQCGKGAYCLGRLMCGVQVSESLRNIWMIDSDITNFIFCQWR